MAEDRDEFIGGLRELADFLEQHEDFPIPYFGEGYVWVESKGEVKSLIAGRGSWKKEYVGDNLHVSRRFAGHRLGVAITIPRELVCERRQVDTRIVPAQEEREVPVYEWECNDPLLAPTKEESNA